MPEHIKIKNVAEVQKKLFKFSVKLGNRITRSALRSGAGLMLKQARREAPKQSGRLRRAMIVQNDRKHSAKKTGRIGVKLKIRPGKSRTDPKGAYYRHMVLGGTVRQKANPFLLRAYRATRIQSVRLVVNNIESAGKILIRRF